MRALAAAIVAAATVAPVWAVIRPYPLVHSCAATGEACYEAKACSSAHDFCDVADPLEFRNNVRLRRDGEHGSNHGVCVPVGQPDKTFRSACNASRPGAQQCGQGMACRLNVTAGGGTCVPAGGGRAGDGCVDDTDCAGGSASGNRCGAGRTCTGIPLGGSCGGPGSGSDRACAAGLRCTGDAAAAGTCERRIPSWETCANATVAPSAAALVSGVGAADPCERGSVCASVSPGGQEPAPPLATCVPLFSLADDVTVDVLPFSPIPAPPLSALSGGVASPGPDAPRRRHNVTATKTGPSLLCSSGFAQAVPMGDNSTHYRLACADPVSSTYLTNSIGQSCNPHRAADPLTLLPYICMPGLGGGLSSALAAPWQWRSDAVALLQSLAMCRAGSIANGSATAGGACGRDSDPSSPGSCAYYACFDLASQAACLSNGLVWDRATRAEFLGGVPQCFADQTTLPEDIFSCVWAGTHRANCSVLPVVGEAAGSCPYRPREGLSSGERDGITLAVVFASVGVIVVGVSCFALRSARSRQEAERSRAWRAGGAPLLSAGAGAAVSGSSLLGPAADERPPSLNGDAAPDGDFYAATAGRG